MSNNPVIESIRKTPVVYCRGFFVVAGKDYMASFQDHREKA